MKTLKTTTKTSTVDLTAIITSGIMEAIATKKEFSAESLANDLAGTYPSRFSKAVNKRIGGNINKFRRLGFIVSVGFTRSTRPNHGGQAIQIWKANEFSSNNSGQ